MADKPCPKPPINYPEKPNKNHKTIKPNKNHKTIKPNKNSKTSKHNNRNTILGIFSANASGLGKKSHSLKHELNMTNSQIFTIQESHFRTKGRLKIKDFIIFESIRKNKEKGGSILGIHSSLEPVLIEEYSDSFELIVAEIKVLGKEVRIMSGYGPQECWTSEEKMPFFVALEEEISKAKLHGKSLILELDANSKLGPTYIKDDPHAMSQNGVILSGIIERHGLIVANGLTQNRNGLITRRRNTVT